MKDKLPPREEFFDELFRREIVLTFFESIYGVEKRNEEKLPRRKNKPVDLKSIYSVFTRYVRAFGFIGKFGQYRLSGWFWK